MTLGIKGVFECQNKDCDFTKTFPFYNARERKNCPACKELMTQIFDNENLKQEAVLHE